MEGVGDRHAAADRQRRAQLSPFLREEVTAGRRRGAVELGEALERGQVRFGGTPDDKVRERAGP
jgi:hypothetical protein